MYSLDTRHSFAKFMTCPSASASHTTESQGCNRQRETNFQCWFKNRTSLKNENHNLVGACLQLSKSNVSLMLSEWEEWEERDSFRNATIVLDIFLFKNYTLPKGLHILGNIGMWDKETKALYCSLI